jgi:hypothetical protein
MNVPDSTLLAPWERAAGRSLSDVLQVARGPGPQTPCRWLLGTLPDQPDQDVEAAGWLVAERVLRVRFGRATHLYDLWREAATTDLSLSERDRNKIVPFVRTAFGLPSEPVSEDHVQGYVAEFVWFMLASELPGEGRTIRRIEQPSFYVTGPGGDGLATYELGDGTVIFRLWEIKKHVATAHLSGTVTRACRQLSRNGSAYLAQYIAVTPESDPALARLYARFVDLWVDTAPQAGAGVAVGTSRPRAPTRRCFSGMQRHFPGLDQGDQLEGLIAAIADFPAFARRVREFVWSAL